MNEKIEKLKKQYHDIPIPDELDGVVAQALFHTLVKRNSIFGRARLRQQR